jgi:hypothetical protein
VDDTRIGVHSSAGVRDYSPIHTFQTGSDAYPASCPNGTRASFLGVKETGGVELAVHLDLISRLRMCGVYLYSP